MNEVVVSAVKSETAKLAILIKRNSNAILQMSNDGSGWDLNRVPLPEDIADEDIETWVTKHCIASSDKYDMPSFKFDCKNAILIEAMALALGLTIEPY